MGRITGLLVLFVSVVFLPFAQAEPQESLAGKVAVITGSSSGLGYELTQLAMTNNMKLLLVDVRPETSEELARAYRKDGGEVIVVNADLAEDDQRAGIIERALTAYGKVDYLFNNAGYSYLSTLAEHDMVEAKRLFDVNYWAYVDLAQQVLPSMLAEGSGLIVNTVSVLGVVPSRPTLGPYAATKHALIGFFQAVDAELEGTGVGVKLVCPGGMKTNIIANAVGKHVDQIQHLDDNWEPPTKVANEMFAELNDGKLFQYPSVAQGMYNNYLEQLSK